MEETVNLPQEDVEVVDIQFRPGQKIYYFDPAGLTLAAGDHVIMDTARGAEFGVCASGNHRISAREVVAPLRRVLRKATAQDERIVAENRAKEKRAQEVCLQKIAEHKLDMQLVSAEVAFDGSKILFYFTADERVDFRELVKNLASVFHTRIELRQIGVRDKAKMVGGLGICGRPFCGASFLEDFQPVSIKMAKTQNLSLNPTKISGTCGRLMCCLKYEQEAYEDLIRTSPKPDSFVDTPDGRGTVVDVNLLRQSVKVRMEQSPETITCYHNCDICVLRNGKAKKNDPPIPADLAPISGAENKPAKKTEREEKEPMLDSIRFRYRDEEVAPEMSAQEQNAEAEAAEENQENRARRRRRQRGGKSGEDRPAEARAERKQESGEKQEKQPRQENKQDKQEKQEKQEKSDKSRPPRKPRPEKKPESEPRPEQQEEATEEAKADAPRRRRPNYRRRKPRNPGEGGGNAEG